MQKHIFYDTSVLVLNYTAVISRSFN